ncbi:DUF4426 domain-containing protein [Halioxenophilus aromaticivorans]|uniref:DUF4426 domain-containing protein n=1 Tax=Halioxenophilus aromaticivorans TaxID=1306992 RepID=A0AAV3U0X5_9ALTE
MVQAIKLLVGGLLLSMAAGFTSAQDGISIEQDGYRIFYSVFNSTMITPKVAQAYALERDNDLAYVNVVITQLEGNSQSLGVPAKIAGDAKNLMQQVQKLKFQTIQEQNTVYYLAPVSHGNEEVYHFEMTVRPETAQRSIDIEFTKKLYVE